MRFSFKEEWKLYAMDRVQFGDKPAAALMTIAVEKASEEHTEVSKSGLWNPQLVFKDAMKLFKDTYIDDVTSGGSPSDISRMMGDKDSEGQFNGTILSLAKGMGLKLKTMVRSGSEDLEAMTKLSGSVLRYKWDATKDLMGIKLSYNEAKKRKGL